MIQRLAAIVRRDFWLKVLALALAILLWAMVVQDYNKETTVKFDIPLEVKPHPTYVLFEGREHLASSVLVEVTGPSLLVSSLTEQDLRAWVDYSQVTVPNKAQEVPVQVEGPSRIAGQVRYRVTPPTVTVTLIETRTVTVPLTVKPETGVVTVGSREYRYAAAPAAEQVSVSGRTDYLNLVRGAVINLDPVDLQPPVENGALREKTTRLSKPVQPVDATGHPVEKLDRPTAEVVIAWEELPPGKRVQVRPSTQGSLPPGFQLVSVTVDPVEITLRSATVDGVLPDISQVQTEPVDLTGQTKSFTTAARVLAPPGTSAAVTSVNVTVTIEEVGLEKIFGALPIAVRGAPAGAGVELSAATVQVRLRGPYTLVNPLDGGAVEVYVDLGGLGPGRHQVPVKVNHPPGLTEVAVEPAMVDVEITNP